MKTWIWFYPTKVHSVFKQAHELLTKRLEEHNLESAGIKKTIRSYFYPLHRKPIYGLIYEGGNEF